MVLCTSGCTHHPIFLTQSSGPIMRQLKQSGTPSCATSAIISFLETLGSKTRAAKHTVLAVTAPYYPKSTATRVQKTERESSPFHPPIARFLLPGICPDSNSSCEMSMPIFNCADTKEGTILGVQLFLPNPRKKWFLQDVRVDFDCAGLWHFPCKFSRWLALLKCPYAFLRQVHRRQACCAAEFLSSWFVAVFLQLLHKLS